MLEALRISSTLCCLPPRGAGVLPLELNGVPVALLFPPLAPPDKVLCIFGGDMRLLDFCAENAGELGIVLPCP